MLLLLWFGYGALIFYLNRLANSGVAFPFALFTSFIVAGCFIFAYLIFANTFGKQKYACWFNVWCAEFSKHSLYIKAHQTT